MLQLERRVVDALVDTEDPAHRAQVVAWVEGTLADMPEVLRAGVLAESVALAAWSRLRRPASTASLLDSLARSPVGLLRQYPRLFRSLVLFADLELAPEDR